MAERNTVRNVLFLAPEWGTITKVGGLADVVASLSQALINNGIEVRTVLLGYRHIINMQSRKKHFYPRLPFFLLEECEHPDYSQHIFYVIRHPGLDAIHEPYSPSYSDNDSSADLLQAILLALAPFAIAENTGISWQPQVVHCHDWLCGLYPYFSNLFSGRDSLQFRKIPSLFTIHNAEYAGLFNRGIIAEFPKLLQQWGISFSNFPAKRPIIGDWELDGKINLLATGLRYAEKINTVSPTHAVELLEANTPISRILQQRKEDFSGILNGVDNKSWAPESDPFLQEHTYTSQKREVKNAKHYWKKYLAKQLQFSLNMKAPLFISICRIVKQKGLEQLFELEGGKRGPLLEALEQNRCQLIILGEGEQQLELQLQMLSWKYSRNFIFLNYFHEG
ncbi:MAG: glycogen/starch synthase, partial [Spirochaetota bacterium]